MPCHFMPCFMSCVCSLLVSLRFDVSLSLNQAVSPLIPGGEDEIIFERDGESFGVADTCQSATVPSYFKPYTTTTPVDWIATGAIMSYGYR